MQRIPSVVCAFVVVAGVLGSGQSRAAKAYVTNSGDSSVSVIDTGTNQVTGSISVGNQPCDVAVSGNGKRAYVVTCVFLGARSANSLSIIDGLTDQIINTVQINGEPTAVAVSPNGRRVYVTDDYIGQVLVYSTRTNVRIARIGVGAGFECGGGPIALALTPDGTKLYVTGTNGCGQPAPAISVIDTTTNQRIDTIGLSGFDIAPSPDGSRMYVANYHGLSVIDTTSDQVIDNVVISTNQPFFNVAVSPDGSKVYLSTSPYSGCRGGFVAVVDAVSDTLAATIPVKGCPSGLALTPRGGKLYVADFESNTVSVINTNTNRVMTRISDPSLSGPNAVGMR